MRKRYGVILAVTGYIIFFFCMKGLGADWKIYATNDSYTFRYDVEDISHPSKNIVRVRLEWIAKPQGISRLVAKYGNQYKDFNHFLIVKEIDCAEKKTHHLEEFHYSTNGKLLGTFKDTQWINFPPGSVDEILYKKMCQVVQSKEILPGF